MRALAAAAAFFGTVGVGGGCSNPPAPSESTAEASFQSLVPLEEWSGVGREEDPFVVDLERAEECVGPGFRFEPIDDWLEIDTGRCAWVTVVGSAQAAVRRGQRLKLTVSHYDLEASAPAEAHLRLRFGDCDAWSKVIDIPHSAAVYEEQFGSPCALETDGRILFHLDNHGQNTYQLQELSSLR